MSVILCIQYVYTFILLCSLKYKFEIQIIQIKYFVFIYKNKIAAFVPCNILL